MSLKRYPAYIYIVLTFVFSAVFSHIFAQETGDASDFNSNAMRYFINGLILDDQGKREEALKEYEKALAFDRNITILKSAAEDYLRTGNYNKALDYFLEVLEKDPDDISTRETVLKIYMGRKEYVRAEELLERIVEENRYVPATTLQLIQIYLVNKKYEEALEETGRLFREITQEEHVIRDIVQLFHRAQQDVKLSSLFKDLSREFPGNGRFLFGEAVINDLNGEIDDAIINYGKALEMDESLSYARMRLSKLYIADKKIDKAYSLYDGIEVKDETDLEGLTEIGIQYLYNFNNVQRAEKIFLSLSEEFYNNFQAWFYLGLAQFNLGKNTEALESLLKAKSIDFEKFQVWYYLGIVQLNLGRNEEALESLSEAKSLNPREFQVWYYLSFAQQNLGKYEEALVSLNEALSIEPGNTIVLNAKADLLYTMEKWDEAEEAYKKVLELDPDNHLAMNNYGYMLVETDGDLQKALRLGEKALSHEPDNRYYLDTVGWVYYKLGDYEKALEYILKASRDSEASATVFDHLGDIYYKLNKNEEALKAWHKALELDKGNEDIEAKIIKVENQR